MSHFHLPDLGEGLQEAEICQWFVKVGDTVKVDEPLVSVETAKAIVEVPSPMTGSIKAIYGAEGEMIPTGALLVEFEGSNEVVSNKKVKDTATVAGKIEEGNFVLAAENYTQPIKGSVQNSRVVPKVRALAEELGVDLTKIKGTGPNGAITTLDVKNATNSDVPKGYIPLRGIRRTMAQTMVKAHRSIVPVTIADDANLYLWPEKEDITTRIILAMVSACQKEPALNAWYHETSIARQCHQHITLGVAMDTDDGLFVPVLSQVDKLSAMEIRTQLNELKLAVQKRTLTPEAFKDPTITLSNFGKFAGRYANPIVVPPQVAILGVGRILQKSVVIEGETKIANVMPLALTFDHRAITGGEATRFLGAIIESLELGSAS